MGRANWDSGVRVENVRNPAIGMKGKHAGPTGPPIPEPHGVRMHSCGIFCLQVTETRQAVNFLDLMTEKPRGCLGIRHPLLQELKLPYQLLALFSPFLSFHFLCTSSSVLRVYCSLWFLVSKKSSIFCILPGSRPARSKPKKGALS